jgi:Rho-binding antiterminator
VYEPLSCDLHDYLEIACLYHYRVHIELSDGTQLDAEALTTRTDPSKEEFFCVRDDEGTRELRLDDLHAITPLGAGVKFGRVMLSPRLT